MDCRRLTTLCAGLLVASTARAQIVVTTTADTGAGSLREAILTANSAAFAESIVFQTGLSGTLTLGSQLPIVTNPFGLSIDGVNADVTIDGGATSDSNGNRILFFGVGSTEANLSLPATTTTTYVLANLRLQNGNALGGSGGNSQYRGGGGGGAGLGGAVFVNAGTLTVTNVSFSGNRAVGGLAGNGSGTGTTVGGGGGGGGMGGAGGGVTGNNSRAGGGGGGGFGGNANGGSSNTGTTAKNGSAGQFSGAASAGNSLQGGSGGTSGGGGAGTTSSSSGGGGGGVSGTDAGASAPNTGGFGGFGGGGGGGGLANGALHGGRGGYGGGGGGAGRGAGGPGTPGSGGFGGGGGGYGNATASGGGFAAGGGSLSGGGGGGGAGLGGAVFVRQGATLNLEAATFSGNLVSGGAGVGGGTNGQGIGSALFLAGGCRFTIPIGGITIAETIGGGADPLVSGGFEKAGAGTLVLTQANTYVGGTTVSAGILDVRSASGLGSGNATLLAGGTLRVVGVPLNLGLGPLGGPNTLTIGGGRLEFVGDASVPVAANSSLAGFAGMSGTSGFPARIRAGETLGGTLATAWTPGIAETLSDIVSISTGSFGGLVDPFILEMSVASGAAPHPMLGWRNQANEWVNAVDGNSAGTVSFFPGGWDAYMSANPLATAASSLGVWGYDPATNTAWAAIDFNGDFAIVPSPVPEPAWGLVMGCGAVCVGRLMNRRSNRRTHAACGGRAIL